MHYVYELIDPRINAPYYVGITNNPEYRYKQHLCLTLVLEEKTQVTRAIIEAGLKPRYRIIEEVEDERRAKIREKYWIESYESQGILLTNILHSRRGRRGIGIRIVSEQLLDWTWQTRVKPIEKLVNPVRKQQRKEALLELIWSVHQEGQEPHS